MHMYGYPNFLEAQPCQPGQIVFPSPDYVLSNTFGTPEEDEIATRLIRLSQKEKKWMCVSENDFRAGILKEVEGNRRHMEIRRENRLHALHRVTALLLIYGFFLKKPLTHAQIEERAPWSPTVFDEDAYRRITDAIAALKRKKLVWTDGIYICLRTKAIRSVYAGFGKQEQD